MKAAFKILFSSETSPTTTVASDRSNKSEKVRYRRIDENESHCGGL